MHAFETKTSWCNAKPAVTNAWTRSHLARKRKARLITASLRFEKSRLSRHLRTLVTKACGKQK